MQMFADDVERLSEFKKQLSQEDKYYIERILKKSRVNADMQGDLKTTLTQKEKIWTANFAWKAFVWGFAEKRLIE
jgi:hypothetical protein